MKRRVFNEFNRRVKADAKHYFRLMCIHSNPRVVVTPEVLYSSAYKDFVETRMISHAFFFVFYKRLFNQYWLDMKEQTML